MPGESRDLRQPGVLSQIGEAVLGLVYPPVCGVCGATRAGRAEGFVCGSCWQGVRFVRPPFCRRCGLPWGGEITNEFDCANCRDTPLAFEYARAAVVAQGVALDVIHRFKYGGAMWFEPFLADLLLREAVPVLSAGSWSGVVPVPLHPVKRREREFNQAEVLAKPLADALGVPLRTDLVRRVEATMTQTRLSRTERAENVRRAFAPMSEAVTLRGDWIVVDDVLTTGATSNAVAAILRDMGASRVVVWSVARAALDS